MSTALKEVPESLTPPMARGMQALRDLEDAGRMPTKWHETGAAKAIFDALTIDDVWLHRACNSLGWHYVVTCEEIEDLDLMRRKHVERAAGMTFAEAHERDLAKVYMSIDARQPDPRDVLADMFGAPPAHFHDNYSDGRAQSSYRASYRSRQGEAA